MAGYKLSYFNIMGRAEVSRLLFAVADEVYEDDRFMHDEWPTRKLEAPLGQVPILTVNGKKINQSLAIHKYLARAFDLYGKHNMENTMCDVVMETTKDVIDEMTNWYFEKDVDRKKDFEKKLNDITYPKLVDFLDKMLKENGGQWLVGDMLTVADLACFDILDKIIPRADNDIFQSTPSLKEHYTKVKTHPRVQAWLEKRPKTEI